MAGLVRFAPPGLATPVVQVEQRTRVGSARFLQRASTGGRACRSVSAQGRRRRHVVSAGFLTDLKEKVEAKNAEALAVMEERKLIGSQVPLQPLKSFKVSTLEVESGADLAATVLETNGVLGLKSVLSDATVDRVLEHLSSDLERAKAAVDAGQQTFDDRFGGVNCRGLSNGLFGYRQDFFLSMDDAVVREALAEAVSNLGPLLERVVTPRAMVHEVSSLVAEPSSPRQCIHCDTIYLPCRQYPVPMKPLYTFFIALQDVEDDMGHTTFLTRTHTEQAHELWNTSQRQKELFIAAQKPVHSQLKKGDVAIFDSRLLHAGGANTSAKRRVLFYFTASEQQDWPLPDGLHGSNSIRTTDRWRWQLTDLGLAAE